MSEEKPKRGPCAYCGTTTQLIGARLCNACWEVDARIDFFVQSDAGAKRAVEALERAGVAAKVKL